MELKFATINRKIPHFTERTYKLLEHLRSKKPKIVKRLIKEDGTYFSEREENEFYYELCNKNKIN